MNGDRGKGEHERRHYSVLEKLSPEGVALVDQRFAESGRKPRARVVR